MENRYDKYKDSGIAWIGEIPEHWEIKRLKNVSDFNPQNDQSISNFSEVGYLPMERLKNGYMLPSVINVYNLTQGLTFFKENDIVMAKVTPCFENGNIAIAKNLINNCGFGSSELFIFRVRNINREYFFYLLQEEKIKEVCKSTMIGTGGLKRISPTFMRNLLLPIPPTLEQQSIAIYLDQKCGEIDELITLQEEMITKLQSYKQSVITEAVTKGLDKNIPLKDSGIEWIGEIPEHWSLVSIGKLFNIYAGGDAKPDYYSVTKDFEHPFPVYTNTRSEHEIYAYTSKAIFPANTITVTGRGDVGHAIYRRIPYDAIIRLLSLIPKNNYDCRFYTYFIDIVIPFMDGKSAVAQLSALQLKPQLVCLPSNKEQQSIADYLDQKCSEIDELISIKQQKIEKLKDYKKSLIFECVTGKRKVS